MPELVHFSIEKMPAMKVVGREMRHKMGAKENPIPAFWKQCFEDKTFETIEALGAPALDGSYVGYMTEYSKEDGMFTYICGIFMKPDCPVPEGFVSRDVTAADVAVGWVQGPEFAIYPVAHTLTQEGLERAKRKPDATADWCAEVYNCPRFTTKQGNGDVILDYYIPVQQA